MALGKKKDPDKKLSPTERAREEDGWLRKHGQMPKADKKRLKKDRLREDREKK